MKRNYENYSHQYDKSERESLEELTRLRSLKIIKEREFIVEARGLAPKALQFSGLSQAQITERVEEDLDIIKQIILK